MSFLFFFSFLTWGQLHPRADLVNIPRVAKEEQTEADHGSDDQQHGCSNEEHGRPEGRWGDGAKVQSTALTHQLGGQRVPDAVVEQAEVSGLRGVDAVPDPERLDEDHHRDNDEADGKHCPHDADGSGVSHVVSVVDLGRLLSWKKVHGCRRSGKKKKSWVWFVVWKCSQLRH